MLNKIDSITDIGERIMYQNDIKQEPKPFLNKNETMKEVATPLIN